MNTDEERALLARIDRIMEAVKAELVSATMKFDRFASAYEGYVVILKEVDELCQEVCNSHDPEAKTRQRSEALQVAAMSCRFLLDIT